MPQNHTIFISYRRSDAAGHARALHRDLCRRFEKDLIFFDRQSIESGDVFPEELSKAVAECQILLALIGPEWLQIKNADGLRRLNDPKDFVRQEITQALALNKKLIPVLFDDTPPPAANELPAPLKALASCDVLTMRGKAYEYDTQLAELVRLVAKFPGIPQPLPAPGSAERFYRNLLPPQPVDPETLEQAQQKLAQMPLDVVPDPFAPSAGSCLVFRSNRLFVGRQQDLMALARMLKGGGTAAIGQVAAATGLGGIGKTQLASEFAHRYGQFFAGVYWLDFYDPQAVPAEVAGCSPAGQEGFDLEARVKQVLSAWQSDLPSLLIFDNCEDENLLEQWLPRAGGSRVLVTSRRQTWNPALGVDMWNLGLLDRHESIKLLRKLAAHLTDDQAGPIAEELGDLPLALHMAGSYLHCYDDEVHPSAFLRQLQDKALLEHDSLKGRGTKFSPTKHDLHVAKTFALSYDRLDPQHDVDRIALALLARAACFAQGTPIPKALLLNTMDSEKNTIDPLDMKDGLSRILDVGLIESEAKGALVLHRLLAAYVKNVSVMDAKAPSDVETALLDEARRINDSGLPAGLIIWQPHLRFVTDQAMERDDETGADLCNTLSYHLYSIGDYEAALPYWEKALEIRKNVLGEEHPDTARSLNNLGALLKAMGDYEAARPYYEKALEIRKNVLGEEHPDTARSLNNLGALLDAMGDYEGTWPYYEQALEIRKNVLGEGHPDTAGSLNNLGALLKAMGDYEAALPYWEKALEIRKNVLGEEHPDTAASLNNLGGLLQAMGDYKGARPYLEKALEIRKKVLGDEHPDTAGSLNNLGFLLQAMGDYEAVLPYWEKALEIRKNVLGDEHPDTAESLNNLGGLLKAMGDYKGARPYLDKALEIRKKVLGDEHPDTAGSLNNLAILCYYEENFKEAAKLMQLALAIYKKVLGKDHPDTRSSMESLSMIEKHLKY